MSDYIQAFRDYYELCSGRLQRAVSSYNMKLSKDDNPIIRRLLGDMADLNEGGKLLRGMLVSLGFRIGGGAPETESDSLALAYEIFQTAILIHDDIIDNARLRRGKVTIHERCEERLAGRSPDLEGIRDASRGAALCIGDYGLYCANLEIAEAYASHPRLARLISYFDGTVLRTVRGELLDVMLPWELSDGAMDEEEKKSLLRKSVRDIYHLKTACYSVIGPLHLGMILAGAPEEHMAALDAFSYELGIAYQIKDDILGVFADSEHLGKDVGSDIAEFKQTILWMYVRTHDPEAARELLNYYGKKDVTPDSLEAVRRIFRESGALAFAQESLNECLRRAEEALPGMDFLSEDDRAILIGFGKWCGGRSK